jgi:hypothetical protein
MIESISFQIQSIEPRPDRVLEAAQFDPMMDIAPNVAGLV